MFSISTVLAESNNSKIFSKPFSYPEIMSVGCTPALIRISAAVSNSPAKVIT